MSTPLGLDRGIRRAIATVCLSGMLEDKLDAVAGAGFDAVEIFEFGILYDREEGGEFYHLHTPVQGSRVFFEVVQRVGSYSSYGAANSAVRMAAQRRERENRLT